MADLVPDLTVDPQDVRPTPEDVAKLEGTRPTAGGGRISEFTENTTPTEAEVEAVIDQAVAAVLNMLPPFFGTVFYERVKHYVCLYAAIVIEGSFFREQLDEGAVELWRALLREGVASMNLAITGEDPLNPMPTTSRRVDSVRVSSIEDPYGVWYSGVPPVIVIQAASP
jgi:hypothetical protein